MFSSSLGNKIKTTIRISYFRRFVTSELWSRSRHSYYKIFQLNFVRETDRSNRFQVETIDDLGRLDLKLGFNCQTQAKTAITGRERLTPQTTIGHWFAVEVRKGKKRIGL